MEERLPVHEKCIGKGFSDDEAKYFVGKRTVCSRIEPVNGEITDECLCKSYVNPTAFWNRGGCPLADHYRPDLFSVTKESRRVGQQKQKKKK
jgi:hypothetical protein